MEELLLLLLQRMLFSPLPEILSESEILKDYYSDPWTGIIRTRVFQLSEASERDRLRAAFFVLPFDALLCMN
jgi:hypothetical protein